MAVAATVFVPLRAIVGAVVIASLKVAVIVSVSPDLTVRFGLYVTAAVGAVVSRLYDWFVPETAALVSALPAASVTLAPLGSTVRPRVAVLVVP